MTIPCRKMKRNNTKTRKEIKLVKLKINPHV